MDRANPTKSEQDSASEEESCALRRAFPGGNGSFPGTSQTTAQALRGARSKVHTMSDHSLALSHSRVAVCGVVVCTTAGTREVGQSAIRDPTASSSRVATTPRPSSGRRSNARDAAQRAAALVHTPSSTSSGGVVLAAETPSDTSDSPDRRRGGGIPPVAADREQVAEGVRHGDADAAAIPSPPTSRRARRRRGEQRRRAARRRHGRRIAPRAHHPATPFDRPTTVVAPATTPSRAEDRSHPSPSVLPPPTLRLLDCTSARPLDRAPSIGAHGLSFLRKAAPALRRAASAATNEPATVAAAPLSPPPPQIRTPSSLAALLLASSARRRRRQQQAEADAQAPDTPDARARDRRPWRTATRRRPRLLRGHCAAASSVGRRVERRRRRATTAAAAAARARRRRLQMRRRSSKGPPDAALSVARFGWDRRRRSATPATPLAATQSPPPPDDDGEETPIAPTRLAPATPAARHARRHAAAAERLP